MLPYLTLCLKPKHLTINIYPDTGRLWAQDLLNHVKRAFSTSSYQPERVVSCSVTLNRHQFKLHLIHEMLFWLKKGNIIQMYAA